MQALLTEIELPDDFIAHEEIIQTIYFGGGTPSLLSTAELQKIMHALPQRFIIAENAEITLEANPDDVNETTLAGWNAAGVNRLSIGVQSFRDDELRWMNRAHNATQAFEMFRLLDTSPITNYSVDLIYGSPLQSLDDLRYNIDTLLKHNVPHISAYALTVEPKTALQYQIAKGLAEAPDEDRQLQAFDLLRNALKANGYEHYELSNFAKPGFHSRHNSSYWRGEPYFGFGPAAHAYNGKNKRRWNIANRALYEQSLSLGELNYEEEILSAKDLANEMIMISLRTMDGLPVKQFEKFGTARTAKLMADAKPIIAEGLLNFDDGYLRLTDRSLFLADGIIARLFE